MATMHSVFAGEFLGTAILIYMGNGVVAGVLLQGSKAQNAGWLAITAGWAFAVLCGVLAAQAAGSPQAHINPAITLFVAASSGNWAMLPQYVPAQFLGAAVGACLVWLHYRPLYAATDDAGAKLATFCTSPATPGRANAWISEILATSVLALTVASIGSKGVAGTGLPVGLAPILVALLVWAIGLSLGGTTGYAINPARDLAPRIMHALLPIPGKAGSGWRYAATPALAPLIGALLAAALAHLFGITL